MIIIHPAKFSYSLSVKLAGPGVILSYLILEISFFVVIVFWTNVGKLYLLKESSISVFKFCIPLSKVVSYESYFFLFLCSFLIRFYCVVLLVLFFLIRLDSILSNELHLYFCCVFPENQIQTHLFVLYMFIIHSCLILYLLIILGISCVFICFFYEVLWQLYLILIGFLKKKSTD